MVGVGELFQFCAHSRILKGLYGDEKMLTGWAVNVVHQGEERWSWRKSLVREVAECSRGLMMTRRSGGGSFCCVGCGIGASNQR